MTMQKMIRFFFLKMASMFRRSGSVPGKEIKNLVGKTPEANYARL
jgi:hypothetical protein